MTAQTKTPKTRECKCPDHEGNRRRPLSEFGKDAKYSDGLSPWCTPCRKVYRVNLKARKAESAKSDITALTPARGRRSATVPTPADVPQPVVDAIDHVNQVLDACAA